MSLKKVFSPEGCRLLVDDIVSELTLEQRASKIRGPLCPNGIEIVVAQENRPRSTSGRIIAVGTDPFLWEDIKVQGVTRPRYVVGDVVFFDWHAGTIQYIEGLEFRSLEAQAITGCEREVLELPTLQGSSDFALNSQPASETRDDQTEQCQSTAATAYQFDTSYRGPSPASPEPEGLQRRLTDLTPSQSELQRPHKLDL